MDIIKIQTNFSRRSEWRFQKCILVMYISLLVLQVNCQNTNDKTSQTNSTKNDVDFRKSDCHSCESSSKIDNKTDVVNDNINGDIVSNFLTTLNKLVEIYEMENKTDLYVENNLEVLVGEELRKDFMKALEGTDSKSTDRSDSEKDDNHTDSEGRALFSKYTYEYRLFQKIKNFIDTHIMSINIPKAARIIGLRSFGINKFFLPILIAGQVLIKSVLFAMFLPSILGSFGKILGKGISQLSATSSQASYPPANGDDQVGYNTDNKDFMGYETNAAGTYAYPQEGMYGMDANDVNELGNVDMSRFGMGGQKVAYLPSKNSYYKNQMVTAANNYKVFQKIPASSMILSNYDPFYSPLLSRLDGIFARLGLAPAENTVNEEAQIGGQSLSDVKLESCREQLICLMYSSPAKYAPYSNLVSAQLSRELNELRRPVSDNPEILRFFRYMRAARRGQEGADCMRSHPGCSSNAAPAHTMIAAYHDINKLVTARKFRH
ncbi:uncharacterized protein LOC115449453 [Manduca sexta]|uniref:Osiris 24 n=1 Tax=Manduca sexta TaxID=7130 RepID=A0A921ZKX8_MANSE|nr:uncharacterized protein LOC115449453 [Manduca sexta]KAG6459416.1 hypothetical protein O3G_MSEX011365 [Manduca sexta]